VVVAIFWVLLRPQSTGNKARPSRINCVNNLKQIGMSFRMWAEDHRRRLATQSRPTYIARNVRHDYSRIDHRDGQAEPFAEVSLTYQARKNASANSTP